MLSASSKLIARFAVIVALTAPASADPGAYLALRAVDQRLAAIAYRLTTANAALCRDRQPVIGATLHAIDQYPPRNRDVRAAFGFPTPVAVELVVPGGPAAIAGVRQDDGLVAIAGRDVPAPTATDEITSATRDAAQALLASQPLDAPLALTVARGTVRTIVSVTPRPGCRVEFEVMAGNTLGASSDGKTVQVGGRLLERYGDDQVAVVVAHELAHAVLRHRARLEAAGASWGVLRQLGKDAGMFRRTETEADLLGAHLLRNAGYDPRLAVRFWREEGSKIDGGIFRSPTHPSARARAAAIEAELATIPADAPVPYVPPLLSARDAPLK